MNEIFVKKGTNKIVLDANYYLEPDQFKGLVLVFHEPRVKEKIDPKTRKKTGESENYIFEDRWYFPKLSQTLNKYMTLTLNNSFDIMDLIRYVKSVEQKIDAL